MENELLVRNFIVENLLYGDGFEFSNDDSFREKGIIDSTGIMQLIVFLEQQFLIKIDDEDIVPENLDSIDRILSFVQRKMNGRSKKGLAVPPSEAESILKGAYL
jgi:acyl carrier protein